jgi:hypothetical protein
MFGDGPLVLRKRVPSSSKPVCVCPTSRLTRNDYFEGRLSLRGAADKKVWACQSGAISEVFPLCSSVAMPEGREYSY